MGLDATNLGTARLSAQLAGLKISLLAGGVAGNHTLTGITTDDELLAVLHFTAATTIADLTSEFTIDSANTIDNTSGTDTSSDQLLVFWYDVDAHA